MGQRVSKNSVVTGGCELFSCLCFHYCLENEEWPKNLHEINEDFQIMLDLDWTS